MVFFCIDCMQKRESEDKFSLHHSKLLYTYPIIQEPNKEKHPPNSPGSVLDTTLQDPPSKVFKTSFAQNPGRAPPSTIGHLKGVILCQPHA